MKIKIRTLTPIHIGTGKELTSLDYYDNVRIDPDKLFDLLAEEKQEEFFRWLDTNQKLMFSPNDITKKFGIRASVLVDKCALYKFNQHFNDKVREGIKDSFNNLLVPGSSIKGSIRTALMYKVLKKPVHRSFLLNHLDTLINKAEKIRNIGHNFTNLLKSADDELVIKVFNCGVISEFNRNNQVKWDDQKFDLLKLVKISDSNSVRTEQKGEISELMVYALRKINPHKNFKVYVESIAADSEIEFDISIDLEFLIKAKNELNNPNSKFGRQYFIGIEQKLNELFDINIINDEEFKEEEIVTNILKAWIDYGNEVSQLEKKWLDTINNPGTANLNSLNKLYSEQNKVKIGFGSGFSAMTMLPLLLNDSQLKRKVFEFYKLVNIGFHNSTKSKLNIDDFPFTRKYSRKNVVYDGFGWVKIIQNGDDKVETIKSGEREFLPSDRTEKLEVNRPPNSILAEIIDVNSKPPKIKILEGEHEGKVTILPGVRLEGLKLGLHSKVYVRLSFQKGKIQSASFVSKVE